MYDIKLLCFLDEGISLSINNKNNFFVNFDIALSILTKSSIMLTLIELNKPDEIWNLHYTCSKTFISAKVKLIITLN